jgi:hypothetical protein
VSRCSPSLPLKDVKRETWPEMNIEGIVIIALLKGSTKAERRAEI